MDLDYRGLKCPQPVLKLTIASRNIQQGTLVTVRADCETFPDDLKKWCQKSGKSLISCVSEVPGSYVAKVQF